LKKLDAGYGQTTKDGTEGKAVAVGKCQLQTITIKEYSAWSEKQGWYAGTSRKKTLRRM
jgi:hypothetical protein